MYVICNLFINNNMMQKDNFSFQKENSYKIFTPIIRILEPSLQAIPDIDI